MQNKDTQAAFIWITNLLKKLTIPFQISGGLAAIAYGANRPLEDIDILIPEEYFSLMKEEVNDFIQFGPAQYKDESWDLLLMTLSYKEQLIDLCGAFHTKIYNIKTEEWQLFAIDFSKFKIKNLFGIDVPVIPLDELLFYKKIIARPVDLIDIEQIEK